MRRTLRHLRPPPRQTAIFPTGSRRQVHPVNVVASRCTCDHGDLLTYALLLFGALAGEPVLMIGTHFASPTAGHVVRDGATYKLVV